MEIKTLEHYIVNELQLKDGKIESLENALAEANKKIADLESYKIDFKEFLLEIGTTVHNSPYSGVYVSFQDYVYTNKESQAKIVKMINDIFELQSFDKLVESGDYIRISKLLHPEEEE